MSSQQTARQINKRTHEKLTVDFILEANITFSTDDWQKPWEMNRACSKVHKRSETRASNIFDICSSWILVACLCLPLQLLLPAASWVIKFPLGKNLTSPTAICLGNFCLFTPEKGPTLQGGLTDFPGINYCRDQLLPLTSKCATICFMSSKGGLSNSCKVTPPLAGDPQKYWK